jgi:ubiquitin thioesterase protein OTUB1
MELSQQEQDIKTQEQVESISNEIKSNQPLTSELLPLSHLSSLFEQGTNFQKGCDYLSQSYSSYRAIRGDGNCYYRAFLYALCEKLYAERGNELKRIEHYILSSIDTVETYGYDRFTIEPFHEEMMDLFKKISSSTDNHDFSEIHHLLNEENATSDYCVWYLRVITSTYLKSDAARFLHFIDDPECLDVDTFCQREIDPMGKEITMLGVIALAEAFGVKVDIEYLDGRELLNGGATLAKHSFGEDGSTIAITMLYRPGHYDILYA